MKNLMYLKNDFVSKESFSRENSQMGLRQYLSSRVRKFLSRGAKILAFDIFLIYSKNVIKIFLCMLTVS